MKTLSWLLVCCSVVSAQDLLEFDTSSCISGVAVSSNLDQTPNPNDWENYTSVPQTQTGVFSAWSHHGDNRTSGGGAQSWNCINHAQTFIQPDHYKVKASTTAQAFSLVTAGWHSTVRTYPVNGRGKIGLINNSGGQVDWNGSIRFQATVVAAGSTTIYRNQVRVGSSDIGLSYSSGKWQWVGTRYYWDNGVLKSENMSNRADLPASHDVSVDVGGMVSDGSSVWMIAASNPLGQGNGESTVENGQALHDIETEVEGVVYDDN